MASSVSRLPVEFYEAITSYCFYRGRSMAAGHPPMRIRRRHRSHWSVQLGCLRERRVLGRVLLCRRLLQQLQQPREIFKASHQHTPTHARNETASVVNIRLSLTDKMQSVSLEKKFPLTTTNLRLYHSKNRTNKTTQT